MLIFLNLTNSAAELREGGALAGIVSTCDRYSGQDRSLPTGASPA